MRLRLQQVQAALHNLGGGHRLQFGIGASGFKAGEVQHVVDQGQKVRAGAMDVRCVERHILGISHQQLGEPDDRIQRGAQFVADPREHLASQPGGLLRGNQTLHRTRQAFQRELDLAGQAARPAVDDAQRAQGHPVQPQRHTRVEPDVRLAGDQRIGRKAHIGPGVLDLEQMGLLRRMNAERPGDRGFAGGQSLLRLEPLTVFVQQADERDRTPSQQARRLRQAIEAGLRFAVQEAQLPQQGRAPGIHPAWSGWCERAGKVELGIHRVRSKAARKVPPDTSSLSGSGQLTASSGDPAQV